MDQSLPDTLFFGGYRSPTPWGPYEMLSSAGSCRILWLKRADRTTDEETEAKRRKGLAWSPVVGQEQSWASGGRSSTVLHPHTQSHVPGPP